jgi:ElaB/YqjD/DUF883 family membrane-anchored ribosome-binding protein
MKNNKETAPTAKDILGELETLVAEAQTMMAGSLTEHSAEAFGSLRERFHAAQERFGDVYTDARRKVAAGARYTDETIRANPYQSLALAAGIGLLFGVLLSRRGE